MAKGSRLGLWWRITQFTVLPIFSSFVTLRIRPGSALPAKGPFIVAPNHFSEIDPIVMGVAVWRLGRTPRFLAKESLFRVPVLGSWLRATGQIPVNREASARGTDALEAAHRLIQQGQGVIVYPEGTLTREPDLWPMKGKTGAVRMALEANIPLYPAAHWGTQSLMARYGKAITVIPRPKIEVIVGPAMDFSAHLGKPVTKDLLERLTQDLMHAIATLVGELRGEQPPATPFEPGSLSPGRPR